MSDEAKVIIDGLLDILRKSPGLRPLADRAEAEMNARRAYAERLRTDPAFREREETRIKAKNDAVVTGMRERMAREARAVIGKRIDLCLEKATARRSGTRVAGPITEAEPVVEVSARRVVGYLRVRINGVGPMYPIKRWPR